MPTKQISFDSFSSDPN